MNSRHLDLAEDRSVEWPFKEGDFVFNRSNGTIGARSPCNPAGLIDPISGVLGTLEYDHGDGISITGGFIHRGSAIPELFGKYVFGDLALRSQPTRVDGRLFYADIVTGEIREFLLPQFENGDLPFGLTVPGFGEDAFGELYALVTNTPANGTGGIVFQIAAIPEPAEWALMGLGLALLPLLRVSTGELDTFSTGIEGWFAGGGPFGQVPSPPPSVVLTGGPVADRLHGADHPVLRRNGVASTGCPDRVGPAQLR